MAPTEEGEPGLPPLQPEGMGWVKGILSPSMFGRDYAKQKRQLSDGITQGEACALIARPERPADRRFVLEA